VDTLRLAIVKVIAAHGGNLATNLGAADILSTLYSTAKLGKKGNDRVFVSNEELLPAVHCALAYIGYFSKRELHTNFTQTVKKEMIGIDIKMPPLGQTLSIAAGCALAAKMDRNDKTIYCLIGDGEHNIGQIWEALLFASKHHLTNLIVIIDRNGIQHSGHTETIMPLEPLRTKYESLGWNVIEVDGHNAQHIKEALVDAKKAKRPTTIIAHTTPGKGVSFAENKTTYIDSKLTANETQTALEELSE